MKKVLLLMCMVLLGSLGCSFAQITGRLEFSAKDDYEDENIVPMEDKAQVQHRTAISGVGLA